MYRFRNRGAEYMSESGVKWMSGSAKRQCDPEPYPGRRWVERAVNKARLQELGARVAARTAEGAPREKVAKLAQKLCHLQPCIAFIAESCCHCYQ